jgi:hypothetical protein
MKTLLATLAILVGLAAGGKAMACGGGASGKLGRLTVKKTYRNAQTAAKNATAGAMTKTILGQDSSGPSIAGKAMVTNLLAGATKKSQTFRVTANDPNQDYTGSAKVKVLKLAPGKYQATILSGDVSASW